MVSKRLKSHLKKMIEGEKLDIKELKEAEKDIKKVIAHEKKEIKMLHREELGRMKY